MRRERSWSKSRSGWGDSPGFPINRGVMKETEALLHFVAEREHVRLKKEAGQPWPWTNDPILRDYKFCCVRREDDRVTKGIATLYREPFENDPELWFALLVARRAVNWPDTLAELGYPVPWNPEHFRAVIRSRQAAGHKAYEAQAYKVMVSGQAGEQADLIVSHVLTPIWERRDYYRPRHGDTLSSFASRLSEGPYMGGFYAGQVVADLKYVQLQDASDWWTFAVSGPGSRRGLDRVLGRTPRKYWAEAAWYAEFRQLCDTVREPIRQVTGLNLHAQDIQGCLCEYDKLCRLRNGEGERSVRRYKFSQMAAQLEQLSPDDSDSTPNEQKSKLENSIPRLEAEIDREQAIRKQVDEIMRRNQHLDEPGDQERLRAWADKTVREDMAMGQKNR